MRDSHLKEPARFASYWRSGNKRNKFSAILLSAGLAIFAATLVLNVAGVGSLRQSFPLQYQSVTKIGLRLARDGALLAELLHRDISPNEARRVVAGLSTVFGHRATQAGDSLTLYLSSVGDLLGVDYQATDARYRLAKVGGDFLPVAYDSGVSKRLRCVKVVVKTDLWDALVEVLPDPDIFAKICRIFAGQIDLVTEPVAGDSLKILYEAYYRDDDFIGSGEILALEFRHRDLAYRAFLYGDSSGGYAYYDDQGYSLRRAILKSPLDYAHITSRFTSARLHPILKIYRPHFGVDFAAPVGTPVVAAGDGIVMQRARLNGFGNYLEISHPEGLVTCYGHLQRFAPGINVGSRVRQGQVIGYVGATGEATGPHLDYRVKKDGRYINPLRMTIPAASPVDPENLPAYRVLVQQRLELLDGRLPQLLAFIDQPGRL